MRPKQAQAVEDDNNRAAFVADDAGGKIDLLCQRRNDQKKDYAKRNDNVLANDRARAPAQGRTPARHSQSCRTSRPRRPVPALHRIRERPCRARHPRRSGSAHRPPQRKTNSRQRQSIVVWLSIATLITATDVAKAGPFRDFFRALRSAIAPPMRSRDSTGAVGAVISIMRLRRAMLRIVRLRAVQSLRLRDSAMSGGRGQPRARSSKKLGCRMELSSPVNQA